MDIIFCVGQHLHYKTILQIRQTQTSWSQLYTNKYFWLSKCRKAPYDEIEEEYKWGRETYLYFCGLYNNPVYGAER